ncbi:MAG TPA: hypothetical protein PK657_03730 [Legionella sp.]|nr:hypothetical protein [Legionella sp.]
MTLFKSSVNGIGTGAGVAWPLFGIVFGAIGGTIGSPVSLMLGLGSVILFFTVTLSVTYFSYKDAKNAQRETQSSIEKNQNKLVERIESYLALNKNGGEPILEQIRTDFEIINRSNPQSAVIPLLMAIKNNNIKDFIKDLSVKASQAPMSGSTLAIKGFFGFVGTFGSIAGCSAGVAGLLTGLGLFSSFAAFPVTGFCLLSAAIFLGIVAARRAVTEYKRESAHQEMNNQLKNINKELNRLVTNKKPQPINRSKNIKVQESKLKESNLDFRGNSVPSSNHPFFKSACTKPKLQLAQSYKP